MPSDLLIPLFSCRAILQAHGFQNSIFSKLLFDLQQSLLESALLFQFGIFCLLLFFQSCIIGKEIRLFLSADCRYIILIEHMICSDGDLPDQQIRIRYPVE